MAKYFFLLALAVCWFIWRGPMRMSETRDSLCPYLGSQLLVKKHNPYNGALLESARLELTNKSGDTSIPTFTSAIYPPTTLVILSIFSQLPWQYFRYFLLFIDTAGLVAVLAVLSFSLGGAFYRPQSLVLWITGLAWAPWHTGMATGNLAIPAISIGIIGWWASERQRIWAASAFLLVSLMLKPQIGAVFIVMLMLRRCWKPVVASLTGWVVIFIATALWMQKQAPGWWGDYSRLIKAFLVAGHENDPSSANPLRHDLINLQRLLYTVFESQLVVSGVMLVLIGLLAIGLIARHKNKKQLPPPLLTSAAVVTIALLPFYHRFYDASLLLFVVAWALSLWSEGVTTTYSARAVFAGCLPFLVPGAAALAWAINRGYFFDGVVKTWWWETFVMSHQVWALLWVAGWLSYTLTVTANKEPSAAYG